MDVRARQSSVTHLSTDVLTAKSIISFLRRETVRFLHELKPLAVDNQVVLQGTSLSMTSAARHELEHEGGHHDRRPNGTYFDGKRFDDSHLGGPQQILKLVRINSRVMFARLLIITTSERRGTLKSTLQLRVSQMEIPVSHLTLFRGQF